MKKQLTYLLMALCLCGHLQAEKEPTLFGELTGRCTWDINMRNKLTDVLKILIPDNDERHQWILENDIEDIGDYNRIASAEWKPRKDFRTSSSESIKCRFINVKMIHGRRLKSMDEYFEAAMSERKKASIVPITADCKKINEEEGTIELTSSNSKRVVRTVFNGDWVIELEYYVNKDKSPDKWETWGKHRDFWLERFASVQF